MHPHAVKFGGEVAKRVAQAGLGVAAPVLVAGGVHGAVVVALAAAPVVAPVAAIVGVVALARKLAGR